MLNGVGGEPGSQMSTGTMRRDPSRHRVGRAGQPAAHRVGADRDHDLRFRHRVVGAAQRLGHPARPGPGDQQDVGVPRARGQEDAEPVHVVDRVQQGQDLPFLGAVRPGVDMPQVHRTAQRGGPGAQAVSQRGQPLGSLGHLGDHQAAAGQRRGRRARRPAEYVGPGGSRTGRTARTGPGRGARHRRRGRSRRSGRAGQARPRQRPRAAHRAPWPGRAWPPRTDRAGPASAWSARRHAVPAAPTSSSPPRNHLARHPRPAFRRWPPSSPPPPRPTARGWPR